MNTPLAFIQNMDAPELIMIFCVIILFFGAKRMPDLARSMGKSIREFKKATSGVEEDIRSSMASEPVAEEKLKKAE